MGVWGRIASSISDLLGRSKYPVNSGTWTKTWTSNGTRNVMTVTKGTAAANTMSAVNGSVGKGIGQVLTWGNTFKVAVVGAFTYLFLDGGASNVVSTTLGIPQWAGQVIVVFAFVVVLMVVIRYLRDYIRDRLGVKTAVGSTSENNRGWNNTEDYGSDHGTSPGYRPHGDGRRYRRCSGSP